MISTIIFIICFICLWLFIALYPPSHKILRKRKTYNTFLITSILSPIITLLSYDKNDEVYSKNIFWGSFFFIIFILLYKYFDNYIIKKHERNLILAIKFNEFWHDDESDKQTSIELLFQILLLGIPIFYILLSNYLVMNLT